jgi:hypothetical protein
MGLYYHGMTGVHTPLVKELQLQILPGKDEPTFEAPGGFLFVNWEKSRASKGS